MSNTTRPFTVLRRRSRLLDILIPKNVATQKYRLLAKSSFDGAFTQIIEADIGAGYLDPALRTSGVARALQAVNTRNHVRITFDPQTFAAAATISDSAQFWLKFQAVDFAGVAGTQTPPTLILPEDALKGDSVITVAGTAPNGAAVANSQVLYLPLRMQDITVRNHEAATDLFVATEVGGAETLLDAGSNLAQVTMARGAQGALLVRGAGATAAFSATMTSFLPL
jgi:hypothetical protein